MRNLYILLLFVPLLVHGQTVARNGVVTSVTTADARYVVYQCDFMSRGITTGTRDFFLSVQAATSTITQVAGQNDELGTLQLTTGTTVNNYIGLYSVQNAVGLSTTNSYTIEVKNVSLAAVPTGSESFVVRVGFVDALGSSAVSNGMFFRCDANAAVWQCVTSASGVTTTVNTSVSVTASANTDFRIDYTGGIATFFINGTQVAAISTNINTSGRSGVGIDITKGAAGTTAANMYLDYVSLSANLPR